MDGLLYGEYDASGDMIREYVYLNGEPLAQIDAGAPETLTYLHTDHLGTPRFGTNSGGTQVWAWDYDAFGNTAPTGSVTVNLRMPGQYYDAESGLFYNWNRYYDPAIGRYISSDPIGLDGGLNTYNYASVSPIMYTDPEGLQAAAASLYVPGGVPIYLPAVPGAPTPYSRVEIPKVSPSDILKAVVCALDPFMCMRATQRPDSSTMMSENADEESCSIPESAVDDRSDVQSAPPEPDKSEQCYNQCAHLLPSPSGDLQSSEYRKCYRKCMGRL